MLGFGCCTVGDDAAGAFASFFVFCRTARILPAFRARHIIMSACHRDGRGPQNPFAGFRGFIVTLNDCLNDFALALPATGLATIKIVHAVPAVDARVQCSFDFPVSDSVAVADIHGRFANLDFHILFLCE
jgi:hypothetical protein